MRNILKAKSQNLGKLGESIAVKHLVKHRYRIVEKNFRKPWGEIDIIATQKNVLVFVEVKALTSSVIFKPEDHFTRQKTERLLRTCRLYTERLRQDTRWRIDLIAIEFKQNYSRCELRHIEGVETSFENHL